MNKEKDFGQERDKHQDQITPPELKSNWHRKCYDYEIAKRS